MLNKIYDEDDDDEDNDDDKNKIFNICKISFNKRYLLHTYMLLYPYCYRTKRNELILAPPWTELTLNSTGSTGNDYR